MDGVAVMGIVELGEGSVLGPQVVEAGEALGAEEALVPHVVEVLHDAVPPRLPQGDEAGGDVEVQADGHYRAEVRVGRRDGAPEVGVVIELGTRGTPIRHHMATRAWATRLGLVTVRISLAAVWVPTSMQ